jgi:hypothetical protein
MLFDHHLAWSLGNYQCQIPSVDNDCSGFAELFVDVPDDNISLNKASFLHSLRYI